MITSKISSSITQRSVSQANNSSDHLERITVLGLFEMTTRAGERAEGHSELAAARLAVSHINEQRLLPGYQLELITNDTKVTSAVFIFLTQ
jgi:gamma-aminobutyric acid type B receptor